MSFLGYVLWFSLLVLGVVLCLLVADLTDKRTPEQRFAEDDNRGLVSTGFMGGAVFFVLCIILWILAGVDYLVRAL